MIREITPGGILIFAIFAQSCSSQADSVKLFGFAERNEGGWVQIEVDDLPNYMNSSRIFCDRSRSEINVVWNSEDGDWAAFDKYSSVGRFFTREIRFAQFHDVIEIVKNQPNSIPSMRIGESSLDQYEYLLNELHIWTAPSDFPYDIPGCAEKIFLRR